MKDLVTENFRERTDCPKDYTHSVIKNISANSTKSLEKKLNKSLKLLAYVILEFIHHKQD